MSNSHSVLGRGAGGAVAGPRVRDRAREAVAVMAFSATASGFLATAVVLLAQLGR